MENKIYQYIDDKYIELIKEIENITFTDYEVKGNFVPVENYFSMLEGLAAEINHLNEELIDLREKKEQDTELY